MADQERHTPFLVSLLAGGLAGTSVDLALYTIDTLKTRLQSPHGFLAAGGFSGVYRGVWAAAAGSAPGAALFFGTYEYMKPVVSNIQRQFLGGGEEEGECEGNDDAHSYTTHGVEYPMELLRRGLWRGGLALGLAPSRRRWWRWRR